MQRPAVNVIVRNLIEALELLRKNLDRVELWTAVLARFQHPAPEYPPDERYVLPPKNRASKSLIGSR
jgi:hypothetical protein